MSEYPKLAELQAKAKQKTAHFCGEEMMEPRARVKDGHFACIPCANIYLR